MEEKHIVEEKTPLRGDITLEVVIDDIKTNVQDPRFMQAIQAIGMAMAQISVTFGPREINLKYSDQSSPLALNKNLKINVGKLHKETPPEKEEKSDEE